MTHAAGSRVWERGTYQLLLTEPMLLHDHVAVSGVGVGQDASICPMAAYNVTRVASWELVFMFCKQHWQKQLYDTAQA